LFGRPAFCIIHTEDVFYTEQTKEALKKLVEFFRKHNALGEMLSYVAKTRDLAEPSGERRIPWGSANLITAWKLRHLGYVTMGQWLSMRGVG